MIGITEYQWKQLIEGAYRSEDPSIYVQENSVDGNDCIREYSLDGVVIARMRSIDGVEVKSTYDHIYEADPQYLPLVEHIYIPTPEEIEEWIEQELDIDEEIAKREAQ